MKKIAIPIFCLISFIASSQNAIPFSNGNIPKEEGKRNEITSFLSKKIYEELDTYCEPQNNPKYIKFSGVELFQKRLKEVFSTVVTTTSDVVENGSAFSYVKDKDANTLSINGAHFAEYKKLKLIIDVGISTKMESDSYKFYAKNSWANDVTGSVGISIRTHFTNKAANYEDYLSQCDSINQIRWQFVNDTLIPKYNRLSKWVYDPNLLNQPFPKELTREKGEIKQKINERLLKGDSSSFLDDNDDLLNTYVASTIRIKQINDYLKNKFDFNPNSAYASPKEIKTTITLKGKVTVDDVETANIKIDTDNRQLIILTKPQALDLKKELTELIEIRNTAIELLRLRDNKDASHNPVKSYIDKKFGKFDTKHDISIGYSISWLTLKTYLTNSAITLKNQDIIDETIQKKIDNLFKLSIELSWNFNYDKNVFVYGKAYSKLNRGSLLDSQVLKTDGFNVFAETSTIPTSYTIQNDNGTTISSYDQLNHPIYNMDSGVYGAILFDKKKSIGFSGQVSFNFLMKDIQVGYKPTYTILFGVLLKAKADAVIVNLSSGFENQYYTTNAWDNFIVKASLGVPFTIFEKKAKK